MKNAPITDSKAFPQPRQRGLTQTMPEKRKTSPEKLMEAIKKQEICLQQKQDELEQKLSRLTEQQKILHDKLSFLGEKKAALHEKEAKLLEAKRILVLKLEEVDENERSLRDSEREESDVIKQVEKQVNSLQQKYEANSRALEQLEAKQKALLEDASKRELTKQRKIQALEGEVEAAQKRLQEARQKEQALRHDWEHQQSELDPLLQQKQKLAEKQHSFMKRVKSEMLEYKHLPSLSEQVKVARKEVREGKAELSKVSSSLVGLERTVNTQLETVLSKQERLRELQNEETKLKHKVEEAEFQRGDMLKENREVSQQILAREASFYQHQEELRDLEAKNLQLEGSIRNFQTQLAEQGEVLELLESKQREKLDELEQREEMIHIRMELEAELDAKFKDFDMTEDSWKRVKENELNKILSLIRQLNEKQVRLGRKTRTVH
mmetsp:Transcript_21886/g.39916  ORF Transcript_21886/g.39916 Transcript_21886/m.39916 type:complete len:437 (+) Transcript_21886:902-2212(+)